MAAVVAFRSVVVCKARVSASARRITAVPTMTSGVKFISTSGKKGDTPAVSEQPVEGLRKRYGLYDKSSDPKEPENRDWISYGFSLKSEADDRYAMMLVGFSGITVLFLGGAFMLAYQPDLNAADWTKREAHLELHRREKLGLPLVSKDYIEPDKFNLPSDEELGDAEIII